MKRPNPLPRTPVIWIGSARRDMQAMPEDVQDIFGKAIDDVQVGQFPSGARPFAEGLPSGILKLVASDGGETYRCAYVAEFRGVVYVLHVFQKKSKSGAETPREDKNRIIARYKAAKQDYEHNSLIYLSAISANKGSRH